MKFHKLEVENFLTLKSASVDLADRGLQLIQGVNADDSSASSNGAGKSSLVDAICWCLYGTTARDVKGDSVVNRGSKKDCRVTLDLTSEDSCYKVTRYRKHTTGKNSLIVLAHNLTTPSVDLSKGTDTETQKVLEKILGCSQEVFMAAVYCGQEAMPDLPRKKDRELKTLIEEAAGMQRIESAYELARERTTTARRAVDVADSAIGELRINKITAEASLVTAEASVSTWEAGRILRVAESSTLLDKFKDEGMVIATEKDSFEATAGAANVRIAEIDSLLSQHKMLDAVAAKAEREVRNAEMKVDKNALTTIANRIKANEDKIANAESEIKKPCTECGTVIESMSVEDFVAHRMTHITSDKLNLEKAKVTAREQVTEVLNSRTKAAAARSSVPDVTELVDERLVMSNVLARWVAIVRELQRKTDDLKFAKAQLVLRETEPNPHMENVSQCEVNLVSAESRLTVAESKLTELTKTFEIASAVSKVFGPTGVRAQILDAVTPLLNEATGNYLSALSDGEIVATWTTLTKGATGELKEKFSIEVTHAKGADSFAGLSGGEKRKVRLACALALQDLVASRATQPIDLFLADEIDDALDAAGLERLMVVLERKARERGTVLLISHSNLKDWCDEVTTVTKVALHTSVVEGSLCV